MVGDGRKSEDNAAALVLSFSRAPKNITAARLISTGSKALRSEALNTSVDYSAAPSKVMQANIPNAPGASSHGQARISGAPW